MPLLGSAALAMWWQVASEQRPEFEDWHAHEHFPERVGIPGFRRGSRWASLAEEGGFFVMYELADYAVLTSPAYRARLDDPTPWSARMMPHHRNMVRSQCRVAASLGGGLGGFMLTLRLSPASGGAERLRDRLRDGIAGLPARRGVTAAHLLITDTPEAAPTREQRIRGGDAVADWILLVSGYDEAALRALAAGELAEAALMAAGARPGPLAGIYRLAYALTAADL